MTTAKLNGLDATTMVAVIDIQLAVLAERVLAGTYRAEDEATAKSYLNQRAHWEAKAKA